MMDTDMEALFMIGFIVTLWLANGWYCASCKARDMEAKAKQLQENEMMKLCAARWVAEIVDFDAAREKIRESLLAEEMREMQEWQAFKAKWRPNLLDKLMMSGGGLNQPHPETLALRSFAKRFKSKKLELHMKSLALQEAESASTRKDH